MADEREEKLAAKLCQFKAAVNYFSEPMFDTEETVYIPSSKIPVSGNDVFVAETQDAHVNDAQYDPSQIIVPSSVPEEDENDDAHSEQLCDFNDETMVQFGSNPDLVEGPRISGNYLFLYF